MNSCDRCETADAIVLDSSNEQFCLACALDIEEIHFGNDNLKILRDALRAEAYRIEDIIQTRNLVKCNT